MTTYYIGEGQTYTTFAEFHAAITPAAGDIVDGGGNTFTENIIIKSSGNADTPAGRIFYQNFTVDCESVREGISNSSYDYITITNVIIINGSNYNIKISSGANYNTVSNVILGNSGLCSLYVSSGTNFIADNITCLDHTGTYGCVYVGASAAGAVLSNLTLSSNNDAIWLAGAATINRVNITNGNYAIYCQNIASGTIDISNVNITNSKEIHILKCNTLLILDNINASEGSNYGIHIRDSSFTEGSFCKNSIFNNNISHGIYIYNSSGLEISNIESTYNHSDGIRIDNNSSNIIVQNSNCSYNNVDGISLTSAINCLIKNNIINYNGQSDTISHGDGITAHTDVSGLQAISNILIGNRNAAFAFVNNSSGAIYHNVAINNGDPQSVNMGVRGGFYDVSTGSWTIKNNIFKGNYPYEINCTSDALWAANTVEYNYYYHIGNSVVESSFAKLSSIMTWSEYNAVYEITNSFYANPLLNSDGSLQQTSPCIDAGVVIAGVNDGSQTDIWGYPIFGHAPNIGASQQYGYGTAEGTLTFKWKTGFNDADVSGNLNILSFDGTTNSISYDADNNLVKITDGTNTASKALTVVANTEYTIQATWGLVSGSPKIQIAIDGVAGTQATFAGTFNPSDIYFGLENEELQYICKNPDGHDLTVLKVATWL